MLTDSTQWIIDTLVRSCGVEAQRDDVFVFLSICTYKYIDIGR